MEPTPIIIDALAPPEPRASSPATGEGDAFRQLIAALVRSLLDHPSGSAAQTPADADTQAPVGGDPPPALETAPDPPPTGEAAPHSDTSDESALGDLIEVASAQTAAPAPPAAVASLGEVVPAGEHDGPLAESRAEGRPAGTPTADNAAAVVPAEDAEMVPDARPAAGAPPNEFEILPPPPAAAAPAVGRGGVEPAILAGASPRQPEGAAAPHPAAASPDAAPIDSVRQMPTSPPVGEPGAAPQPPVVGARLLAGMPVSAAARPADPAVAADDIVPAPRPSTGTTTAPVAEASASAPARADQAATPVPPRPDSAQPAAARSIPTAPLPARPAGNFAGAAEPSISPPAAETANDAAAAARSPGRTANVQPPAREAAPAAAGDPLETIAVVRPGRNEAAPVVAADPTAPTPNEAGGRTPTAATAPVTPAAPVPPPAPGMPAPPAAAIGTPPLTHEPAAPPQTAAVAPPPADGAAQAAADGIFVERTATDWTRVPAERAHAEPTDPAPTGDTGAAAAVLTPLQAAGEAALPAAAARAPAIDQVAHAVARGVDEGASQVTVRLHPPVLGTVRVTLTMSDSGDVSAQLSAATELGRRLLHDGLPRLATALADRGIDVGQLNVAVGGHDAPAPFFDHSPGWEHAAEPPQAPAPVGLPVEDETNQPPRLLGDGHHLIDLLA